MIEIKLTPDRMHAEIEALVENHGLDYIDAALHYAETNNLEVETVAAMIKSNAKLKAKVKQEGEDLNFLPKAGRLPLA